MQTVNSIHGTYVAVCNKRGYATKHVAAAQLRLLQARGRTEESYYECKRCGSFHLTGRKSEDQYRIEAANVIQVGNTRIGISRKVTSSETTVAMRITFNVKDGSERQFVYAMTPEQGQALLDAFILALYDNGGDEPQDAE